jgi:hypothetical protein
MAVSHGCPGDQVLVGPNEAEGECRARVGIPDGARAAPQHLRVSLAHSRGGQLGPGWRRRRSARPSLAELLQQRVDGDVGGRAALVRVSDHNKGATRAQYEARAVFVGIDVAVGLVRTAAREGERRHPLGQGADAAQPGVILSPQHPP